MHVTFGGFQSKLQTSVCLPLNFQHAILSFSTFLFLTAYCNCVEIKLNPACSSSPNSSWIVINSNHWSDILLECLYTQSSHMHIIKIQVYLLKTIHYFCSYTIFIPNLLLALSWMDIEFNNFFAFSEVAILFSVNMFRWPIKTIGFIMLKHSCIPRNTPALFQIYYPFHLLLNMIC